ncbi:hypothetical protein D3C75_724550 [compost metagenome]
MDQFAGQIAFEANERQLLSQRIMQIPCYPLPLLHYDQLGDPLVGILQLPLQLVLVIAVVGCHGQQHYGDHAHQHERKLRNKDPVARNHFIVDRSNGRQQMNRIQREETCSFLNISDKKSNE